MNENLIEEDSVTLHEFLLDRIGTDRHGEKRVPKLTVSIYVPADVLLAVDRAKGDKARSQYVVEILRQHLRRQEVMFQ